MTVAATPVSAQRATLQRRLVLLAKIGVSAGALVWLFHIVPLRDLGGAFARVPASAIALCVASQFAALTLGTVRWRALLAAYGAVASPGFGRLFHLYLVGQFYNVLLPGAVGGDVVRGYATRAAFGETGATAAVAVAFVERVLGLAALLLITGCLAIVRPLPGIHGILPVSVLGVAASVVTLGIVSFGHRLGPMLPGVVGRTVARLPSIARPAPFVGALALSFGTQGCAALGIHPILASLDPHITLTDTMSLVPLGMAAAYFPFTVGGAGTREGAFVALLATVGVAHADALATSLLSFAAGAIVASVGGVMQLVAPLDTPSS